MKIFLFIILKILELSVLIYVPYLLGRIYNNKYESSWQMNKYTSWGVGWFFIGVFSMFAYLLYIIGFGIMLAIKYLINFNWALVEKILS